jgi:signal transduction histidine kinase
MGTATAVEATEPIVTGPRRSISLTVRLALTYALLVGATLLVVLGLAVQLTRSYLSSSLDRRLTSTIRSFQTGPAIQVRQPEDLLSQGSRWLSVSAFPGDQLVAIRGPDADGDGADDVLTNSGGIDVDQVAGGPDLLFATESRWWNLQGPDGSFRALTVPLQLEGDQVGTLVVGASRGSEEGTLAGLVSGIVVASAIGLGFATLLGVLVVRRTLRPLRRMATEVATIQSSGDLSKRVDHRGPRDEVGQLAAGFDRMLSRLEAAFASQRRFLGDASHELRTPLTVVRGQLELMEEGLRSPEARRSLALATEELERMRRIVDDLLLLARLDEGTPLHREPVEVELVLREALLRGMQLARREARVDAEAGLYAMADFERVLQVLTNLVTNAVRHAGEDAAIILRARRDGGRILIEVEDTGPGIPPEELPHIFDRLYRGSAAKAAEPAGAGLGLSIVASLTQAMGGDVGVESAPGQGTTFRVWLPSQDSVDTEPIPQAVR